MVNWRFSLLTALFVFVSLSALAKIEVLGFGKQFDDRHLQKTFSLDLAETLNLVREQKIKIFVMPQASNGIQNYGQQPQVRKKINRAFKSIFDDKTLGLYLSHEQYPQLIRKNTILLSSDSSKWTLLHEYMHALLDQSRQVNAKKSPSESELANSIQDIREDYLELYGKFKANSQKFSDDSHQIAMLENLIAMTKLVIQLQQLFALEEVAIDRYLQRNYMQSKIKNLDAVEFANSVRYLRKNLINAKNALFWLKDHHDTLLAALTPERAVELDNSAESLRQLVLEIKSIEAEIENY